MNKVFRAFIIAILIFILGVFLINIKFNIKDIKNNPIVTNQSSSQEKDILYFAYGSNMNINQMNNRCPDGFEKVTNAKLNNYAFGFDQSGYANLKDQKNNETIGILYQITELCLKSLDGYEGYPDHYNRKIVMVIDLESNKQYQSQVYIQSPKNFGGKANQEYLGRIIIGAKENQLPES